MLHYLFQALNNYANFSGRASRKEYWLYYLTFYVIQFILNVCFFAFFSFHSLVATALTFAFLCSFGYLFFIPDLAIQVRRLHDLGKGISGWWICVPYLLLYYIWLIVITLAFLSPHSLLHLFSDTPQWIIRFFEFFALHPYLWSLLPIHVVVMGIPLSLRGSAAENKFGLPQDLNKLSQGLSTFTKNLKNSLVAFIMLFICILSATFSFHLIIHSKVIDKTLESALLCNAMDSGESSDDHQVLSDDADDVNSNGLND
jgi:uncharacterized membrane protein YhaH (DUF805 family)